MKELHRPLFKRSKVGLTVAQIAKQMRRRHETVARLPENHGYLELCPFGRSPSRRLMTADAYAAGHGHNLDGAIARSKRLDGPVKAVAFAVFYPEHLPSIIWALGGI